ncbi:hypothetical protein GCM10010393_33080 [Streptomyces gobitricini]|uniref:Uncharacterized protein n=1 Tax=Streptomyces gobitricini TaxID=68211 RepID=A0ABN3MA42_9ACTN
MTGWRAGRGGAPRRSDRTDRANQTSRSSRSKRTDRTAGRWDLAALPDRTDPTDPTDRTGRTGRATGLSVVVRRGSAERTPDPDRSRPSRTGPGRVRARCFTDGERAGDPAAEPSVRRGMAAPAATTGDTVRNAARASRSESLGPR